MVKKERRRSDRSVTEIPVFINLLQEGNQSACRVPGTCKNISPAGALIELLDWPNGEGPLRLSQTIGVVFRYSERSPGMTAGIQASIRWSNALVNKGPFLLGVEFTDQRAGACLFQEIIAIDQAPGYDNEKAPLRVAMLIPRRKNEGTAESSLVDERLKWIQARTGVNAQAICSSVVKPDVASCFVENFVGAAQIPIGLAGPLKVRGEYANGLFYVPFATTESTLVKCYEQGMIALTRAGGVRVRLLRDETHISPIFLFSTGDEAFRFTEWIRETFLTIKEQAQSTTKHGRLLRINPVVIGNRVITQFFYETGDAMGLNMIVIATEKACEFMAKEGNAKRFYLRCNFSSDKKASFMNFCTGYGKTVSAEAIISCGVLKHTLGTRAEDMFDFWFSSIFGTLQSGLIGLNAQYANALAAIFIACGQDVASIVNSSMGISWCELRDNGSLYTAVRIPTLVVGTVGGGTSLPTQKECLAIMGCLGSGKAKKFAELIAGTLLAGEVAICASFAQDNFSKTHLAARRKRLRTIGEC